MFQELLLQRKNLEKYLNHPEFGSQSRPYIVNRLHQLYYDYSNSKILNDRGTATLCGSWTPKYPTDSQLIMNLFTQFIYINQNQSHFEKIYDDQNYYKPNPEEIIILQKAPSCKAPQYSVIDLGTERHVYAGGCDYAIAIWMYLIHKKKAGFVGGVCLKSKFEEILDIQR